MNTLLLEPDDIDFDKYMRDTETAHKVKAFRSYEEDINGEFDDEILDKHPKMPWASTNSWLSLRPAECSLWFGFNGHGKSHMLGQVIMGVVDQGERACIVSLEMKPRKTLAKMARHHADAHRPSPDLVHDFIEWSDGKLWVYDHDGLIVDPEKIYAVIRYAVDKLNVTHFVIDNLTMMIESDDDYRGQKVIVQKMHALAMQLGVHIHLVHHARKDRDETRPPRKMDALGASAITNLVDNVFVVWRNKAKYEAPVPDTSKPDAMLLCDKQRFGTGKDGVVNLNLHARSQQFIDFGKNEAHHYGLKEAQC